ncbi:MAG TPA: AI-2E family transporter [Flavobacterium sp.]|jgi:predicted PurR-regulated permease PerM|nr:AI-2E family transporter [Flavobacterium sp.]HQX04562.1 AI-2E family transporter [Flavobacterium sp.]HRZ32671.1 AI-2E family transporter [Flavobacterium sp.]HRZ75311.1 AI-2E family transporter [Flavobacterium sp.]
MVVTPNKENSNALNLLFIIGLVFCLYILKPIIVPLIMALILTVSVFPLVNFLEKKFHVNRVFSALTAIFTLSIVLFGLLAFVVFQLTDILEKSDQYILRLTEVYNTILNYFDTNFGIRKSELSLKKLNIGAAIKDNFTSIIDFLTSSGSVFSDIVLIPLYMFFFLIYRKFFKSFLFKAFSVDGNILRVKSVLAKLYKVQQNYLYGLFTVMFIVGLLNTLGLLILGIENALFFGFLAAILLLIPYIGIMIGSLLPALVALATKDSAWYAVGVIAVFMLIQMIEGNYITPKITGSKVSINSFVAILSIILFSMLWGTAGMIVALPVIASLKVVFDSIPELKPYGFLIGEPLEEHLRSDARIRLKNWKKIKNEKST